MQGKRVIKFILQHTLVPLMLLGLVVPQAQAAKDQFKMKINISGTVIATGKCTFDNRGELSKVSFGDVRYNNTSLRFLEGDYRRPLASNMSCSGDSAGNTQMTFSSMDNSSVSYEGKALLPVRDNNAGRQSPDLAIRLWVNGVVQNINKGFTVDMTNQPKLDAELVQIGNGKSFVSGGTFSASATLTMEFL